VVPQLGSADDEESLGLLRLVVSIGILFLLLYFVADLRIHSETSFGLHLAMILGMGAFLASAWTRILRRYFRPWAFAMCVFIMAVFIVISAFTGDPVSRDSTIILCPFATASFVNWSPRWQFAMGVAALLLFALAQILVPIHDSFNVYRWFSVLAAAAFAQSTAIFISQYRTRIRGQLEALEAAARFREREIATMAHDIRNPVSALAGYVELLEEPSTEERDRARMIARIGSTAWNTNLVVSNALDLYRMEESGRFNLDQSDTDPNPVLADVAEDCAAQARRLGTRWSSELGSLPHARIDRSYLERIVRNLAAVSFSAAGDSQVSLTASVRDRRIAIEVNTPGARISAADLDQMTANPRTGGRPAGAGRVGLFLARAMTEAAGGALTARRSDPEGLYLCAEVPCSQSRATKASEAA
jgi:signal transduction histidine kinase